MKAMHLSVMLFMIFSINYVSTAFAQEGGDYLPPPEQVVETVQSGQPYYAGMTKNDLYKFYPVSSQKSYYKEGDEEWILFDDILTNDNLKDIIVFYLKDGVVSGWKKKEVPKTPEETFQTIVDRRKKYGGADLSGSTGGQSSEKKRRPIYQPPRFQGNYYY